MDSDHTGTKHGAPNVRSLPVSRRRALGAAGTLWPGLGHSLENLPQPTAPAALSMLPDRTQAPHLRRPPLPASHPVGGRHFGVTND